MTTTDTTPLLDPQELATYHARADDIVERIIACDAGARDDGNRLIAELECRFVAPLTDAYGAIPVRVRAASRKDDIDHADAVWQLVYAYAGAAELASLMTYALGECGLPACVESLREAEIVAAGMRYCEHFGRGDSEVD